MATDPSTKSWPVHNMQGVVVALALLALLLIALGRQEAVGPHEGSAGEARPAQTMREREFTFYRLLPEGMTQDIPGVVGPGSIQQGPSDLEIQVAAFRSALSARGLADILGDHGIEARIETVSVGGAPMHRVRINEADAAAAQALAQSMAVPGTGPGETTPSVAP